MQITKADPCSSIVIQILEAGTAHGRTAYWLSAYRKEAVASTRTPTAIKYSPIVIRTNHGLGVLQYVWRVLSMPTLTDKTESTIRGRVIHQLRKS